MKRKALDIVALAESDSIELAWKIGCARSKRIARAVAFWNESVAADFRGRRRGEQRILERRFLAAANAGAPRYLEEVRAMAEGAGIPFADLFRLNITELRSYAEKCTTFALPMETARGRHILLAHNEDWDPKRNDVFVLRAELPEVTFAVIAYDGYLPGLSAGINSHGVCHSINYLPAPDRRVGLPRIFITRRLAETTGIRDMLAWIRRADRAYAQSIHIAQEARYLNIELTARRMALRRPRLPDAHANHFLSALKRLAPPPSASSGRRLATALRLLEARRAKLSPGSARAWARRLLSDRSGWPLAIWREADHREDRGATLASALVGTDAPEMLAFRRAPERSRPIRIEV